MSKARVTLFPNGVSNALPNTFSEQENLRTADNYRYHGISDNFDRGFTALEWGVIGVGTEVLGIVDGAGGVLSIATGTTDEDNASLQAAGLNILWDNAKEVWFRTKIQVDDATLAAIFAGITDGAADPIADLPENGIFFRKDEGDLLIDLVIRSADAEVVLAAAVGVIADDVDVELAFHYNGVGGLRAYVDDALVFDNQALTAALLPVAVLMSGNFFVENGEAAARTVLMDYLLALGEA
jgi:hypothetical protein